MFEQSNSEKGFRKGGYRAEDVGRLITDDIMKDESEQHKEELAKANYETYGNGKYIIQGTMDRIYGTYDDSKFSSEADRKGYEYGYFTRGNKALETIITTGKFEISNDRLFKPENLEEYIKQIAEKDALTTGFEYKELPKGVQDNELYSDSYILASLKKPTR